MQSEQTSQLREAVSGIAARLQHHSDTLHEGCSPETGLQIQANLQAEIARLVAIAATPEEPLPEQVGEQAPPAGTPTDLRDQIRRLDAIADRLAAIADRQAQPYPPAPSVGGLNPNPAPAPAPAAEPGPEPAAAV
jgi:hypothetical protein